MSGETGYRSACYRTDMLRAMQIVRTRIYCDPDSASASVLKQAVERILGDSGYVSALIRRGLLVPVEGRTRAFRTVYELGPEFLEFEHALTEKVLPYDDR